MLFPPLTMLRVIPKDPLPNENTLPLLPPLPTSDASEASRKEMLVDHAIGLIKRSMASMERVEDHHECVPFVRVAVQPVYTGV